MCRGVCALAALTLPPLICRTSHSMPGLIIERWKSRPLTHAKRRRPSGVVPIVRSVPPGGAAGPEVCRLAVRSAVPWQSDFNECTTNPNDVTYADWNVNYPNSDNDEELRRKTKVWTTMWWPAHRPLQYAEVTSVANVGEKRPNSDATRSSSSRPRRPIWRRGSERGADRAGAIACRAAV